MIDAVSPFSVTMKLPYPVSANRYWRHVTLKSDRKGGIRTVVLVSSEGQAYREDIGWRAKAYGFTKPAQGRVRVDLRLYPGWPKDAPKRLRDDPLFWDNSVKRIDIDNARKVLYDSFKGTVFVDDFWVFADSAEVMEPLPDQAQHIVVTVSRYEREVNPQCALL